MALFLWGWLIGIVLATLVAVVGARAQARRLVTLERRAQQAERLAELGTLTSGLAHEIKNPLSTMTLNLQLLKEQCDPRDPASGRIINRLNTLEREAVRLRDILDDFLRYAGQIELDRQATNLNDLLAELADFFSAQATQHKVQLRLKVPEPAVVVSVDARYLKQAVLNLMINALQAMTDGGELIMSVEGQARQARIEVVDTGPGIAPDVLSKVFDAYYSTKRAGTGLGLAIARRIIEQHGGRIEVKSTVGKGSNFSIVLPMDQTSQRA